MELTQEDNELIQAATDIISQRYSYGKHHVGVALRTQSGNIVTGVNLDTYIGRAGVCAEAVALGSMVSGGESVFTSIVAVFKPNPEFGEQAPYVASPCGVCREMLNDYGPEAAVIYMLDGVVVKTHARELLPGSFAKKHLPR
jgi:cytidine deaminase